MPIFATFLFNVFAAFAGWLAKYLTQKVAVTVAMSAILTALFAALYIAAKKIIGEALAVATSFDPMFGAGIGMVISPHSAALVSGYITFWSLVELYKWKVNLMQLWSRTI